MTKFLILALLTFLGGSKVHAQILTLTKSDLTGLSLEKNEAFRCRSSEQEFAFELKFSTSTGPYHRVFCPDDTKRILWKRCTRTFLPWFREFQVRLAFYRKNVTAGAATAPMEKPGPMFTKSSLPPHPEIELKTTGSTYKLDVINEKDPRNTLAHEHQCRSPDWPNQSTRPGAF
jgi:hypothetical protein